MRQEKHLLLDEVKDQIDENKGSFLVMRYVGLTANKATAFRRTVRQSGGSVAVMRKRILKKAAEASGINLEIAALPGHIGVVYTNQDPIEMTKLVIKFGQENAKMVQVIGGRFDGQLYNAADVEKLSKLPDLNGMRSQLLGLFEAPMAQTLAVMEALLSSVVYCLDNKCKESEEQCSGTECTENADQ